MCNYVGALFLTFFIIVFFAFECFYLVYFELFFIILKLVFILKFYFKL